MRSLSSFVIVAATFAAASAPTPAQSDPPSGVRTGAGFDCGYHSPAWWMAEVRAAVARGEIEDPRTRKIPPIPNGNPAPPRPPVTMTGAGGGCLTRADIFPYEDTQSLLLTNFSNGQLISLMVDAANAVLATHGDNYDFVGYWINFQAHHQIGAAFYKFIENDVHGIGDPSTQGTPIFNFRPQLGLGGDRIEGFIMMWDINSSRWQPGTGGGAAFTRLALGQEFEHRWALFLPDLLDGRRLQGTSGCGRVFHWNWKVDGQGSCMEISEWVGSNPAVLQGSFVTFNTDIGGIFSWTDLYLMGYVSPSEMDAGNSELRYMHDANCSSNYLGNISSFSSADIIASAGPRVPDWTGSPKDFRTAWVMIHLPGRPPTPAQLDKATAILEQHMVDWSFSTLGRGTMDNSLAGHCARLRIYGCGINPIGSARLISGVPAIGATFRVGVDNPLGTQRPGSVPFLFFATAPDPAFPCGTSIPGLGMGGAGAAGELLLSTAPPDPFTFVTGFPWFGPGIPAPFAISVPVDRSLIGASLDLQGLLHDPTNPSGVIAGLTNAIDVTLGL